MAYIRNEEEVDRIIEEMKKKTKGQYITQGVSFNKDNERQMQLLKYVLLRSTSFSGFVKDILAQHELSEQQYASQELPHYLPGYYPPQKHYPEKIPQEPDIDIGNFL